MRRAAALLLAAAAIAGCGGGDEKGAALRWEGEPKVARHPEIPGDVLVTARLRNDSGDALRIDAADVRVVDASGRPVRASVTFAAGYSHSLYPPRDTPKEAPAAEAERLGRAIALEPGAVAPLTLAWHARDGRGVRVKLGEESLELPAGP